MLALLALVLPNKQKTCCGFVAAPATLARGGSGWTRNPSGGAAASAVGRARATMVAVEVAAGQGQLEKLNFLTPEVKCVVVFCTCSMDTFDELGAL